MVNVLSFLYEIETASRYKLAKAHDIYSGLAAVEADAATGRCHFLALDGFPRVRFWGCSGFDDGVFIPMRTRGCADEPKALPPTASTPSASASAGAADSSSSVPSATTPAAPAVTAATAATTTTTAPASGAGVAAVEPPAEAVKRARNIATALSGVRVSLVSGDFVTDVLTRKQFANR